MSSSQLHTTTNTTIEQDSAFLLASLEGFYQSKTAKEVKTFLSDINSWLTISTENPNISRIEYFQENCYNKFILHLFNTVALNYLSQFSESDSVIYFHNYFSSKFSSRIVWETVIDCLRRINNTQVNELICEILTKFIDEKRIPVVFTELQLFSNSQLNSSSEILLNELVSLPDRIANKLQRKTPTLFMANNYFNRILEQLLEFIQINIQTATIENSFIAGLIYFFTKLSRLGHAKLLVDNVLPILLHTTIYPELVAFYSKILLAVQVSSLEAIIQQIFIQLTESNATISESRKLQLLQSLFGEAIKQSQSHTTTTGSLLFKSLLTHKFLLLTPLSPRVARLILKFLFDVSYKNNETSPQNDLFDYTLVSLGKGWSTETFIQHTDHNTQAIISESILYSLNLLNKQQQLHFKREKIDFSKYDEDNPLFGPYSNHPVINSIMHGVQIRLNNPISSIRTAGMKVAQAFSLLIDPTKPLDFELDKEEKEELTDSKQNNNKKNKIVTAFDAAQEDFKSNSATAEKKPIAIEFDPDDESDLRKVPLPIYLRDVIEYFKRLETRDYVEAGLERLEQLIYLKPADLTHIAAELAGQLLQLGTTVFLEDQDLNHKRLKSLTALIVCAPAESLQYCIDQFYSKNQTIRGKLDILDCALEAAAKLSNIKQDSKQQTKLLIQEFEQNKANKAVDKPATGNIDHQAIIRERVEKTTRRWGKSFQHTHHPAEGVNQFASLVHLFFFPLAAGFQLTNNNNESNSRMNALRFESMLLSRLLDVLGMFIIYTGQALINRTLCKQLFEILLITRHSSEAAIRHVSLLDLSRILLNLNSIAFQTDYETEIAELIEWLNQTSQNDSDEETRRFTRFCLHLIEELLGNPFEQLLQRAQKQENSTVKPILRII